MILHKLITNNLANTLYQIQLEKSSIKNQFKELQRCNVSKSFEFLAFYVYLYRLANFQNIFE